MKKLLLILACIAGSMYANAQITVSRADMANPGDWYLLASDTTISASNYSTFKQSGNNITWDISGFAKKQTLDTTFYADGFTFPTAPAGCNLVSYYKDQTTGDPVPTYMILSNSSLKMIMESGVNVGTGGAMKLFAFPSTMGTSFKDSMESYYGMLASDLGLSIPLVDSVRIVYKVLNTSNVDGYGKLKLEAGSYDVLRQKTIMEILISFKIRNLITGTWTDIPAGLGPGSMNQKMVSYLWISTGMGHPMLQANEDTLGNITDIEYITASSRGMNVGFAPVQKSTVKTKVYPIPARDEVTVEVEHNKNVTGTLAVYDILGNEVMPAREIQVSNGNTQLPIRLDGLKPGVYFYKISGPAQSSGKFVVQ